MNKKILIVEDNEAYREAARQTYKPEVPNISFAGDYKTAVSFLHEPELKAGFKGIIIDGFFPQETGTGLRDAGRRAIELMAESDSAEITRKAVISEIGKLVDLNDPEAARYVRRFASAHVAYGRVRTVEDAANMPVIRAVERCCRVLGKEGATRIFKNTFGTAYHEREEKYLPKDHFGALEAALEQDESNQVLGILVADEAEKVGLPLVLATSGYHHGIGVQAIVNYCNRRGWTMIDCPEDNPQYKETPEFWDRVYDTLNREIGGQDE